VWCCTRSIKFMLLDRISGFCQTALMASSHPRPTLLSIARELGVSRATVSNAYNRPDQLSPALRSRILAHADKIGFAGPDPAGRRLRGARLGAVGVLIDQRPGYAFADPAASVILDGISRELQVDGLGLLIHAGAAGTEELRHIRDASVEAWIVLSLPDDNAAVSAARVRGKPVVVLDQPELDGVPLITVDDRGGTASAAEYLWSLGHRRFGVLTMPLLPQGRCAVVTDARFATTRYRVMRERVGGVLDALHAREVDDQQICIVECASNDPDAGAAGAQELIARSPGLTAVLALSDQIALGALRALHQMDLHVPDRVSVLGFDDAPPAAHAYPPLSTIAQPMAEKGLLTGRYVRRLLTDVDDPGELPDRLPTRLVVRESTARAPW
jgi:DNA-binding LacI/PurR family transcriptional regulator